MGEGNKILINARDRQRQRHTQTETDPYICVHTSANVFFLTPWSSLLLPPPSSSSELSVIGRYGLGMVCVRMCVYVEVEVMMRGGHLYTLTCFVPPHLLALHDDWVVGCIGGTDGGGGPVCLCVVRCL